MKKINLQPASFLGLILIIISFFIPSLAYLTKLDTDLILRLINSYLIAYLAYMISFMDTRKVLALFLPLITYTIINVFLISGLNIKFDGSLVDMIYLNIRNLYDLIALVGIFFLIEFITNRLLGNTFTSILALVCLAIFFYYDYSKILIGFTSFKDIFLYLAIYIMALRVRAANRISPILYLLAIGVFLLEIYLDKTLGLSYGYLISFLAIIYLVLKKITDPLGLSLEKFMIFAYIYIFPSLCLFLNIYLDVDNLLILVLASLITFFLGQILYWLRISLINYIFLGIN